MNFSFLLIFTIVPLPNFLWNTMLSTVNAFNLVLRSVSVWSGFEGCVGVDVTTDLTGCGWTIGLDWGRSTFTTTARCLFCTLVFNILATSWIWAIIHNIHWGLLIVELLFILCPAYGSVPTTDFIGSVLVDFRICKAVRRDKSQKWPDNIFLSENLVRLLIRKNKLVIYRTLFQYDKFINDWEDRKTWLVQMILF